jgi:hypothetical protein
MLEPLCQPFLYWLFFFLFGVLGLELRAYTLSHSTSPLCEDFFFPDIGS